jgi:hypothetical protein
MAAKSDRRGRIGRRTRRVGCPSEKTKILYDHSPGSIKEKRWAEPKLKPDEERTRGLRLLSNLGTGGNSWRFRLPPYD